MDIDYSTYDGTSEFFLEKYWSTPDFLLWMNSYWTISIWIGILYVTLVFVGQYYMKNKRPYDLRLALFLWNTFLAIFSFFGTIRMLPELIYILKNYGYEESVCNNSFYRGHAGIWGSMFVLSKVVELIDTLFIVLRKQKLIFLHWYHHVATLWVCWHSCNTHMAVGRWFAVMNFAVHTIMYSYYAFRSARFRIPKFVNILITSSQIVQMSIGIHSTYTAYVIYNSGVQCSANNQNLVASLIMYISYFVLFAQFFYKVYIDPTPRVASNTNKDIVIKHSKIGTSEEHHTNGYIMKKDL